MVPNASGLADALFSDTQQRVLGLHFGQPERSFYANELIGLAEPPKKHEDVREKRTWQR